MCGIFAVLGCADCSQAQRARVLACSRRLKHRGPDWSGVYQHEGNFLAQQRLAVVSPLSGDQPLFNEDRTVVVVANGEIYNHKKIRKQFTGKHVFTSGSDCEVIIPLYEEYGENFVDMLDGVFAFVLYDTRNKTFMAARDAIGVNPLYIGWGGDGSVWFASEMKALNEDCVRFEIFPPGHLYSSAAAGFRRWYNPAWFLEQVPATPYDPLVLRAAFEKAVVKRLMTDVPFGVLLSGGLDSSLVASVTKRHLVETEAAKKFGTELHSFVVGLEGSPDLKAAREVADYLGTIHHEFHFTVQDGIDAIEEVIYHDETYDVTTIRASTPMFLMARKIKSLGVKMVLSGEGSDELLGGYLYFHFAPNKEEFHKETCRKVRVSQSRATDHSITITWHSILTRESAGESSAPVRLPARQQGDLGLGPGGPRAVPRQGVHRRRNGHGPRMENVRQESRADREVGHEEGVRRRGAPLPAKAYSLQAERAVQ
jgi:asparagine synthase (glutamine-hydrolysing)